MPKLTVGNAEESNQAMTSQRLFRDVFLWFAGFGLLRALLSAVRPERLKPSIFSSPLVRGGPQVPPSVTTGKISPFRSLLVDFLPLGFAL